MSKGDGNFFGERIECLISCLMYYFLGCSVKVFDVVGAFGVVLEVAKPKARCLEFSPCGTYLAIWEPYVGEHFLVCVS